MINIYKMKHILNKDIANKYMYKYYCIYMIIKQLTKAGRMCWPPQTSRHRPCPL